MPTLTVDTLSLPVRVCPSGTPFRPNREILFSITSSPSHSNQKLKAKMVFGLSGNFSAKHGPIRMILPFVKQTTLMLVTVTLWKKFFNAFSPPSVARVPSPTSSPPPMASTCKSTARTAAAPMRPPGAVARSLNPRRIFHSETVLLPPVQRLPRRPLPTPAWLQRLRVVTLAEGAPMEAVDTL